MGKRRKKVKLAKIDNASAAAVQITNILMGMTKSPGGKILSVLAGVALQAGAKYLETGQAPLTLESTPEAPPQPAERNMGWAKRVEPTSADVILCLPAGKTVK
jgi:hypothetical protein